MNDETDIKNCPFCGKEEKDFYMSSKNFAAIYNLSPIVPGHSLVIPKRHYESLFELNEAELAEFISLGRDVAKLLAKVLSTDAFNWAIQEKTIAGQSVPHLHMHVVPRKYKDLPDPGDWYQEIERVESLDRSYKKRLKDEELRDITGKLKKAANPKS